MCVLHSFGARPISSHEAAGALGALYGRLVAASIGHNRQYVGEDIREALEIYRFIHSSDQNTSIVPLDFGSPNG
jgi:hypothetical protein